jgi:hypothetical protein
VAVEDFDPCIDVIAEWSRQNQPNIPNWPQSYGLLERTRISRDTELGMAYSLRDNLFAIVPIKRRTSLSDPIMIERKYDTDALYDALVQFSVGGYDFKKKLRFRRYPEPEDSVILRSVRVSRSMEIAFAYCYGQRAYAILRYHRTPHSTSVVRVQPDLVIERQYDDPRFMASIRRFANAEYSSVTNAWHRYNRAVDDYNARVEADWHFAQGGPGPFNRGYSAKRPNVKLPTQADWGDT